MSKTIHILVLEDQEEVFEAVEQALVAPDRKVYGAHNLEEAWEVMSKVTIDMMILDIMIDGQALGLDFAAAVKDKSLNIPFLFLTSMVSKSIFDQAKSLGAFQYLVKPFNALELQYSLDLALEQHYKQEQTLSLNKALVAPQYIFVKKKRELVKLTFDQVLYMEVSHKYVDLVTLTDRFVTKMSLTQAKKFVDESYFKQTHRNFVVNMNFIESLYLEDNLILMQNQDRVPFSERRKREFVRNENLFF